MIKAFLADFADYLLTLPEYRKAALKSIENNKWVKN